MPHKCYLFSVGLSDTYLHKCMCRQFLGCKGYFARINPNAPEKLSCNKISVYKLCVDCSSNLSKIKTRSCWKQFADYIYCIFNVFSMVLETFIYPLENNKHNFINFVKKC